MNTSSVIRVQNLSKTYKLYHKPVDRLKESIHPFGKSYHHEFYAVRDVSFSVRQGEMVGIIGKNGSGKSTLLKMLTGVLTPSAGDIQVNGRISSLLELGAGFNPEFTGMENIFFYGMITGFTKEEMEQKVNAILQFADIGEFVHQPVKTYSSGMFARLAFAVAINVEPDILIVDEALSVGDIFFQAKCYQKFNEFKKQGKTILFVTHDMSSIVKYCDRAIILNEGVLVKDGAPAQMVDIYKKILVNLYDDSPEDTQGGGFTEADDTVVWRNFYSTNTNALDYGNGQAEIIDFAIIDDRNQFTNTIHKGRSFQLRVKIKFHQTVYDPIIAFTIKDTKGTEIAGTNTLLENLSTGEILAGRVIEVSFSQAVHLQGGSYIISLGCTGFAGGEFVVYHRLYDILELNIISTANKVGFFDMNSQIEIKKLQ